MRIVIIIIYYARKGPKHDYHTSKKQRTDKKIINKNTGNTQDEKAVDNEMDYEMNEEKKQGE